MPYQMFQLYIVSTVFYYFFHQQFADPFSYLLIFLMDHALETAGNS